MAIFVDNNENIKIYRGDTGNIKIVGLPEGKSVKVSFAISEDETDKIILEKELNTEGSESVIFKLSAEDTELMEVAPEEKYHIYYYGVKLTQEDGAEDTLIPRVIFDEQKNPIFQKPNKIYWYPKYVEGAKPVAGE